MFRLREALLAVEVPSDKNAQPDLITLEPGCILRLLEEPSSSGLVDVQVGGKRYTVFYTDVRERGELVPNTRASGHSGNTAGH